MIGSFKIATSTASTTTPVVDNAVAILLAIFEFGHTWYEKQDQSLYNDTRISSIEMLISFAGQTPAGFFYRN